MDSAAIAQFLELFPAEVRPAIVTALTTLFASVVGVAVIFWQIGRQARNAIRQNQHSEALKRKLALYEQLTADIKNYSDAEADASSFVRNFAMDVALFKLAVSNGYQGTLPRARYPDFSRANERQSHRAIELIGFIERWQILDSRLAVFQTAFNVALHEIREHTRRYLDVAMRSMPVTRQDTASGETYPWTPPNDDTEALLKSASEALLNAYGLMGCYAIDFQTEMQKLLVGELFKGKIALRDPIDPHYRVVTLRDYRELERHFDENTEWGKHKAEVLRETTARVKLQSSAR